MESVLGTAGEVTPLLVSYGGQKTITDGAELSKAQVSSTCASLFQLHVQDHASAYKRVGCQVHGLSGLQML